MALGLVRSGVPFSVAFGGDPPTALDQAEMIAFTVIFGELEGGEFEWSTGKFKDKPTR